MRVMAPTGTKRKRAHRECVWEKREVKPHPWFKQHGHGNLHMQARAVPSCSTHAGRFVAAPFTWTVGSIRPADIKLTEVSGDLRRGHCRDGVGISSRSNHITGSTSMAHGNLRMQARAMPSCMQQACVPCRHRTLHMDCRNHQDPQSRDATGFNAMVRTAPALDGTKRK